MSVLRKGSGGPPQASEKALPQEGGEWGVTAALLRSRVQGHECRTASGRFCSWVLSGAANFKTAESGISALASSGP